MNDVLKLADFANWKSILIETVAELLSFVNSKQAQLSELS